MVLTTHAIVGATASALFPSHPLSTFCVAFASHFFLDAIPHWDYSLSSQSLDPDVGGKIVFNKSLGLDAAKIVADFFLGFILAAVLFFTMFDVGQNFWLVLLCAFAGMLPDGLQFLYTRFPYEPLKTLQNFHTWIHSETKSLKEKAFIGVTTQIAIIILIVAYFKTLLF